MLEDTEPTGGLGGDITTQVASAPATEPSAFDFTSEDTYAQFYESLPDNLKAHETLKNTKSVHALADQLVNAQSALGTKRLPMPQADWGEEQWNDFYSHLRECNQDSAQFFFAILPWPLSTFVQADLKH